MLYSTINGPQDWLNIVKILWPDSWSWMGGKVWQQWKLRWWKSYWCCHITPPMADGKI